MWACASVTDAARNRVVSRLSNRRDAGQSSDHVRADSCLVTRAITGMVTGLSRCGHGVLTGWSRGGHGVVTGWSRACTRHGGGRAPRRWCTLSTRAGPGAATSCTVCVRARVRARVCEHALFCLPVCARENGVQYYITLKSPPRAKKVGLNICIPSVLPPPPARPLSFPRCASRPLTYVAPFPPTSPPPPDPPLPSTLSPPFHGLIRCPRNSSAPESSLSHTHTPQENPPPTPPCPPKTDPSSEAAGPARESGPQR